MLVEIWYHWCMDADDVLAKIERRVGSEALAHAWYRSKPLPGFDGRTAMQLVKSGKAQQVIYYIDAVDTGVYA
ncbi:MAG: hypothetical protein CL583_17725 [Alteromonadaceae bacterium]|nr:hypothetical protein [Alteromonadaceae bacterium]|tara:strand:+ start:1090 stop:1308 length:219 start_codon:yes stop_codon:yes gene_type:complete